MRADGLLPRLVTVGVTPEDGPEERLEKAVVTLSTSLVTLLSCVWVVTYLAIGHPLAAAIPFGYQVVSVATMVVFARTKRVGPFRTSQLWLRLILPFLLQLSLGGFVPSSGVILWSITAPLGALTFLGTREAIRWFVGYGAIILCAGLLQPFLSDPDPPIPDGVILVFGVLNLLAVSTTVFVLLRYVVIERQRERDKSDRLLLNVLPGPIAARLRDTHETIADGYDEVTVLFADIVDFTGLSLGATPAEVVGLLDELFTAFDDLAERHGLEKIKTIGDAYMVAGGIPIPRPDHAEAVAEMALDMIDAMARRTDGRNLQIRIGIDSGPVVAGVIGRRKFIYDLWGDTVNTASRMESHGLPGSIQVTERTYRRLCDRYTFSERGTVDVKGKGQMRTWLLRGRKGAERAGSP